MNYLKKINNDCDSNDNNNYYDNNNNNNNYDNGSNNNNRNNNNNNYNNNNNNNNYNSIKIFYIMRRIYENSLAHNKSASQTSHQKLKINYKRQNKSDTKQRRISYLPIPNIMRNNNDQQIKYEKE